ncbi:MAG: glycoside hydrolase family 16 protein [Rhodopila sp.]|jgi:beta-glucanase (GH16 family)
MWRVMRASLIFYVGSTLSMAHPQEGQSIDLSQYKLVFDESFSSLDVSAWGPDTRWIAHTPWAGDFGDAQFADPKPGFPFIVSNGELRIEARKGSNGKWQSGLLASQDSKGQGFALQYGYFEMRAKMPPGPGVWPSFWLDSAPPSNSSDPSIEIDVIEYYGQFPGAYNSTVIVWPHAKNAANHAQGHTQSVKRGSLYEQFHTYGVSVDPEWIVMYFDRKETWRVATPPEHKHALMILLNLALGSGWPIDKTPNPSFMDVEYVRAYAPRS